MFELDELLSEMERNSALVTDSLNATFHQVYEQTAQRYPHLTLLSTALVSLAYVVRYQFKKKPEPHPIPQQIALNNQLAELAGLKSSLELLNHQQEVLIGELRQETAILVHFLKLFKTHAQNQHVLHMKMEEMRQGLPTQHNVEDLIAKLDNLAVGDKQQSHDNDELADLERLAALKEAGIRQKRLSEKKYK